MTILGIAVGGALGALARYGASGLALRWLGAMLPWGTLAVNLAGCFLLGLLTEVSRQTGWVSPEIRTTLAIGFLGGFTTFSTFGVETFRELEAGEWVLGFLNIILNVAGGIAAVVVGVSLTHWLIRLRSAL